VYSKDVLLRRNKVRQAFHLYHRFFKERTMTSIHGHEVLNMMLANGQSWTSDRLVAAIDEKFGREARFHTCSQEGMTARELVDFLAARGKFIPVEEGFVTHKSKICNH